MLVMFDSTTPSAIPATAQAVAGYVGGDYTTWPEVLHRWPHARHLSIAVNAEEDADCLDVEKGDATPQDAPRWFHRQLARGLRRKPKFYCSLSVVPELERVLLEAGVRRDEYEVWSAHYTGVAHVCDARCGLAKAAEATQWDNRALGRTLDESLCGPHFFEPAKAAPLAYLTPRERVTVQRFAHLSKHPQVHPRELAHTRGILVRMRKETWLAAVRGVTPDEERCPAGWDVHDRRRRYRLLKSLTT